jgi:ribose transport system permease protein
MLVSWGGNVYRSMGALAVPPIRAANASPERAYLAFSLSAVFAAFVGVLLATRIGIGNATQADGWELQAIASTVIGGTSLFGAVGSVHGPLIGAFILATINNGANLLNVNSFWQRIITGGLIVIIVYCDGLRRRRI